MESFKANNFFTSEFLKNELNEQQRAAVTQTDGAMIVIAGAGSGKTRVITARMAHLILCQNVDPSSILALTFTNKAAGEMKERLANFLGASTNFRRTMPFVGTFHSYCLMLLRTNPNLLPFKNPQGKNNTDNDQKKSFSIMDDNDQKNLLKKIIKKNNLVKQVSASQLAYQISRIKNKLDPSSQASSSTSDDDFYRNPIFKELYATYEAEKSAAHCLDFDDLLIAVLKIFQQNKDFKEKFQSRVKHILVDEYQDTNAVQHELLKEMGLNNDPPRKKKFVLDSLCAVGDEDQSIYSWRGAIVTNMLSFKKDFSPVTTIKIEQNYRSVQPILKAANYVIQHNKQRHPKTLWSDRKAKNRILHLECQSGYHEADTIATCIKTLLENERRKKSKASPSMKASPSRAEIVILYRTHFQSRSIEESLIKNSIPYTIIGGIRFYERKEIKDLLAYLRLIVNPFDRISLFRVINCPTRGLGAKFEELLYDEWNKNPFLDFRQILERLGSSAVKTKKKSIEQFLDIFKVSPSMKDLDNTVDPNLILSKILEKTEYFSYLKKAYDQREADTKIENVQELARSIAGDKKETKKKTLEDILHDIALLQEKIEENEEQNDHVNMMTLHAAKGLEFNTVIISGLEEGLLPSTKSLISDNELEEERRLFYVGITRAKERLILTHASYRNTYGQINDQEQSRFIAEMPSTLLHQIDLKNVHPTKTKFFVSQWLNPAAKITPSINTFAIKPNPQKQNRFSQKTKKNSLRKFTSSKKTTTPAKKTTKISPAKSDSPFKRNEVVKHKVFGMGVIKKVEKMAEDKFFLTIFFKIGQKRISSRFVKKI